ncbi:hypothetical protein ACHAXS_013068 [Conticribra weissflogii]
MKAVDLSSTSSFRTSNTSTLTCSTAMSSKPSDGSLRLSQNSHSHSGPRLRRVSKSYITSLIRGFDDDGNQLHDDDDDDDDDEDEHDCTNSNGNGTGAGTNVSQLLKIQEPTSHGSRADIATRRRGSRTAGHPAHGDVSSAPRPPKRTPICRHCSMEDLTSLPVHLGRQPSDTMTYAEFLSRRHASVDHAPLTRGPSSCFLGGSNLANLSIKILNSNSNINSNSNFDSDPSPLAIPPYHLLRRCSLFTVLSTQSSCIVFVNLEGYSKNTDVTQRHVTRDFMETLRNILTFAYSKLPDRESVKEYVILPTGDGAAVCVLKPPGMEGTGSQNEHGNGMGGVGEGRGSICGGDDEWEYDDLLSKHSQVSSDSSATLAEGPRRRRDSHHRADRSGRSCQKLLCSSSTGLRSIEETALWIGSSLLLWAKHRSIGMRVGLNSCDLSIVQDPYGDPNVCGDAINMAARIMDTAMPGQILVCSSTVVPKLNLLRMEDGKLMGESMSRIMEGMGDAHFRGQREGRGSACSATTMGALSVLNSRRGRSDSCWSSRRSSIPDEPSAIDVECREHPHMKYTIS